MKDVLIERLKSLQYEYDAGQKMLAELEAKRNNLTSTMLQIQGAMMVLKELIDQPDGAAPAGPIGSAQPI